MTIGNKIAHYRKQQNITQDALAQKLEVTNQAVSKWESGQCCPDIMLLPRLADIFEISVDELFDRQPPQARPDVPWPDDDTLRVVAYHGHRLLGAWHPQEGFQFEYNQTVSNLLSVVSVRCGDVTGNVDAGLDVYCGNVGGDVDAGTDVQCGDVNGNVDAGTDVQCGNVTGNVDAGTDVTCGDVTGDVDAGCSVKCTGVGGSIDAGGSVTIEGKTLSF